MTPRSVRPVMLYLPVADFEQLAQLARALDRDPMQQARWMLRKELESLRALAEVPTPEVDGEAEPE